jgi:hypothetical protein
MSTHPDEGAAAPERDSEVRSAAESSNEPALLFCPICDSRLLGHRCKLVCPQCGYFMSCADYY